MSKNRLLVELEELLAELVVVAKELVEHSTLSIDEQSIAELQEKEDQLIKKIKQLDGQISKKYPENEVLERFPEQWKVVTKLLKGFQKLNEQFVNNLSVRKELIGKEITETRRRRGDLAKMKKVYLRTPSIEKKKSGRINQSA